MNGDKPGTFSNFVDQLNRLHEATYLPFGVHNDPDLFKTKYPEKGQLDLIKLQKGVL